MSACVHPHACLRRHALSVCMLGMPDRGQDLVVNMVRSLEGDTLVKGHDRLSCV